MKKLVLFLIVAAVSLVATLYFVNREPYRVPYVSEHGGVRATLKITNLSELSEKQIFESFKTVGENLWTDQIENFRVFLRDPTHDSILVSDALTTPYRSKSLSEFPDLKEGELTIELASPTKLQNQADLERIRTRLQNSLQKIKTALRYSYDSELLIVADRFNDFRVNSILEDHPPNSPTPDVLLSATGEPIGRWVPIGWDRSRVINFLPSSNHFIRDYASRELAEIAAYAPDLTLKENRLLVTQDLEDAGINDLEVLVLTEKSKHRVSGENVMDVFRPHEEGEGSSVVIILDDAGVRRLNWLVKKYQPQSHVIPRHLALVVNDQLIQATSYQAPFDAENGVQITGDFSETDVEDMVAYLQLYSAFQLESDFNSIEYVLPTN